MRVPFFLEHLVYDVYSNHNLFHRLESHLHKYIQMFQFDYYRQRLKNNCPYSQYIHRYLKEKGETVPYFSAAKKNNMSFENS